MATQELESFILARAAQDTTFRQALLTDPREAISRELGIELPSTLRIEVVETAPDQLTLVLPPDDAGLDRALLTQTPTEQIDFDVDCCCCC